MNLLYQTVTSILYEASYKEVLKLNLKFLKFILNIIKIQNNYIFYF